MGSAGAKQQGVGSCLANPVRKSQYNTINETLFASVNFRKGNRENREQRTERPYGATGEGGGDCVGEGKTLSAAWGSEAKP